MQNGELYLPQFQHWRLLINSWNTNFTHTCTFTSFRPRLTILKSLYSRAFKATLFWNLIRALWSAPYYTIQTVHTRPNLVRECKVRLKTSSTKGGLELQCTFIWNVYKADKKYGLTLTRDQNYFPFEVRHVCYLSKGNHSHSFRLSNSVFLFSE